MLNAIHLVNMVRALSDEAEYITSEALGHSLG